MIVGKIIKAFFRFIIAIFALLAGSIVVIYTMVWDLVSYRILRKPKKENPSFDYILEKEKHSKSETDKILETEATSVTKN